MKVVSVARHFTNLGTCNPASKNHTQSEALPYLLQIFAVRACTSGIGGKGALGTGSYQKVAQDQSSRVSASPSFQAICWIVIWHSFSQAIGSGKCHRYIVTKLFSFKLQPL